MTIKRSIVATHDLCNPGFEKSRAVGGPRLLVLECGHEDYQKRSEKTPMRRTCRRCTNLSNGAIEYTELQDGSYRVSRWDSTTQLPVETIEDVEPSIKRPA